MIKYRSKGWDTWDDGSNFEQWLGGEQLIEGVTPAFVLDTLRDGNVRYVDLEPRQEDERTVCFVRVVSAEKLCDSPAEAVHNYASWDVDYYEKQLSRAKEVLAYINAKMEAGENP